MEKSGLSGKGLVEEFYAILDQARVSGEGVDEWLWKRDGEGISHSEGGIFTVGCLFMKGHYEQTS